MREERRAGAQEGRQGKEKQQGRKGKKLKDFGRDEGKEKER